jgi:flagellar basal-body rod protein FlgB
MHLAVNPRTDVFLRGWAMLGKVDNQTQFLQDALNARAYRQQLLASNIANGDTPNYKAVDIDFSKAMQQALGVASSGSVPLAATAAGHMQSRHDNPLGLAVKYRTELQPSIDGNTVDMDVERAQFTDNAIHYQALITFLNNQFRDLRMAIQGQ